MYQTGTHGSVGGRLANQSSASYPIRGVAAGARHVSSLPYAGEDKGSHQKIKGADHPVEDRFLFTGIENSCLTVRRACAQSRRSR